MRSCAASMRVLRVAAADCSSLTLACNFLFRSPDSCSFFWSFWPSAIRPSILPSFSASTSPDNLSVWPMRSLKRAVAVSSCSRSPSRSRAASFSRASVSPRRPVNSAVSSSSLPVKSSSSWLSSWAICDSSTLWVSFFPARWPLSVTSCSSRAASCTLTFASFSAYDAATESRPAISSSVGPGGTVIGSSGASACAASAGDATTSPAAGGASSAAAPASAGAGSFFAFFASSGPAGLGGVSWVSSSWVSVVVPAVDASSSAVAVLGASPPAGTPSASA
mmetsp:Transcript_9746/g.25036  ORF Transcript_9746/g.25036 Transcript_9746/m.25036 type:complete len:278 (+) Transcript_9746:1474-2307(+)